MCYYDKPISNKHYQENKTNRGHVPPVLDPRKIYVNTKCGRCQECRKAIARDWTIRLNEHIKTHKNGQFVTLTLSDKEYTRLHIKAQHEINALKARIEIQMNEKESEKRLRKITGYGHDNQIATIALREFANRWRKKHGKDPHHWLITELGHEGTHNIHLHGIIWTDHWQDIEKKWKMGFVWDGYSETNGKRINYVNGATIGYSVKYMYKIDEDHTYYKPKILCSKGIGKDFIYSENAQRNKFNGENTKEDYITQTGHKLPLPKYYKNAMYYDDQKAQLWTQALNKNIKFVGGEKLDMTKGTKQLNDLLEHYRKINKQLGYGDNKINWNRYHYEMRLREIMQQTRIKRANKTPSARSNQKGLD